MAAGTDPYVTERLARVRRQLDRLDGLMAAEKDPQRIDRLASAQYRLAEQERILSGRPLPGSRRPARDRAERPKSWLGYVPGSAAPRVQPASPVAVAPLPG
jgi:hypothetical protein